MAVAPVDHDAPMTDLTVWLPKVVAAYDAWLAEFGPFAAHPSTAVQESDLERAFDSLTERLRDNYPFGHPRYVGQMLKPPHPAAVIGYLSAMLINPNNHALDGGPATARMEHEVVSALAGMFGMSPYLGHLTSSGTIANLEALWVARESHPGKAIAFSADAHYTHARMCSVLGVRGIPIAVDASGRMDCAALQSALQQEQIGTVVATLGTTGLGALDPLPQILELTRAAGVRVHVDTAYGGFFALIADDARDGVAHAPFEAIAQADSVVVDPHKHGLQPYGCGAVLFADPAVQRFYRHDSPYTYFSSDELHLGEISLECSRAGAAAAGLWLTLQVLPLSDSGLGSILRATRAAALQWYDMLLGSRSLEPYQLPELDIVTYLPVTKSMTALDQASAALFHSAAALPAEQQVHLATYAVTAQALQAREFTHTVDASSARILRSTVMKPESGEVLPTIQSTLEGLLESGTPN